MLPLGNRRVIERTANRCESSELVHKVVVAVGDEDCNEAIVQWCKREGIEYSIGSEKNLLQRHNRVVGKTGADTLVRVTADSPFIYPDEIDRLVEQHRCHGSDYTTNFTDRMPVGTIVDIISSDVLEELGRRGESHPVARLRNRAEDYDVRFSDDSELREISDAHLEVNTPKQYWALIDAFEDVGSDTLAIGRWLINR